jgi:pterin-4a-carbinolamine dehydratase
MTRNASLKNMMQSYFDEVRSSSDRRILGEASLCIPDEVPVAVSVSTWEIVASPNRLMKTFEFDNFDATKAFLDELLNYQEDVGHHAKLTVDARKIIVEVYTHDVDDVTELDTEYAVMADAIHEDVKHFIMINMKESEVEF